MTIFFRRLPFSICRRSVQLGYKRKPKKCLIFHFIIFCGPSKWLANENCKPHTTFYCPFFWKVAKIDYLQAKFIEKRRNLRRSVIPSITDFFVTVWPYIIYRLYQMVFLTRLNWALEKYWVTKMKFRHIYSRCRSLSNSGWRHGALSTTTARWAMKPLMMMPS